MRQYHKALLVALACALALAAGLGRAYLTASKPLTSAEVLGATRRSVDAAVDVAIELGGLDDAEAFVATTITEDLRRQGFAAPPIRLIRQNDLNPLAAFFVIVAVGDLAVRFDIEGTRDPLLAMRLGMDVRIRADPFHPYASHGEPGILAACLEGRFYHLAPEGPDLFARLENRTSDPYHFGFETFVASGGRFAVDHGFLETGVWGLDGLHRERYGL